MGGPLANILTIKCFPAGLAGLVLAVKDFVRETALVVKDPQQDCWVVVKDFSGKEIELIVSNIAYGPTFFSSY